MRTPPACGRSQDAARADPRLALGQLDQRVDALAASRGAGSCDRDGSVCRRRRQDPDDVGQVAARPGRCAASSRGSAVAQRVGREAVDPDVDLVERELARRRVARLDDRARRACAAAHDAAVGVAASARRAVTSAAGRRRSAQASIVRRTVSGSDQRRVARTARRRVSTSPGTAARPDLDGVTGAAARGTARRRGTPGRRGVRSASATGPATDDVVGPGGARARTTRPASAARTALRTSAAASASGCQPAGHDHRGDGSRRRGAVGRAATEGHPRRDDSITRQGALSRPEARSSVSSGASPPRRVRSDPRHARQGTPPCRPRRPRSRASLAFYLALLGEIGVEEDYRTRPTAAASGRLPPLATKFSDLGVPTAASTATTRWASNTWQSPSTPGGSSTALYARCSRSARTCASRPRKTRTFPGTGRSSSSTRTASGWRSSTGPARTRTRPARAGRRLVARVEDRHDWGARIRTGSRNQSPLPYRWPRPTARQSTGVRRRSLQPRLRSPSRRISSTSSTTTAIRNTKKT